VQKHNIISILFFLLFFNGVVCVQDRDYRVRIKGVNYIFNTVHVYHKNKKMFERTFHYEKVTDTKCFSGLLWIFLGNIRGKSRVEVIRLSSGRQVEEYTFEGKIVYVKEGKRGIYVATKKGRLYMLYRKKDDRVQVNIFDRRFASRVAYTKCDRNDIWHVGLKNGDFYLHKLDCDHVSEKKYDYNFFKFHSPVIGSGCTENRLMVLLEYGFYIFHDRTLKSQYVFDCKISNGWEYLDQGFMVINTEDHKMYLFDSENKDEQGNTKKICCYQLDSAIERIMSDHRDKRFLGVFLKNNKFYTFDLHQAGKLVLYYQFDAPVSSVSSSRGCRVVSLKNDKSYFFDMSYEYRNSTGDSYQDVSSLRPSPCLPFDSKVVKWKNTKRLFVAVTRKGAFFVFDTKNKKCLFKYQFQLGGGKTIFAWDKKVFCCLRGSEICVIDLKRKDLKKGSFAYCFQGAYFDSSKDIQIKYQDETLLLVDSDGQAYVFHLPTHDWRKGKKVLMDFFNEEVTYARYDHFGICLGLKNNNCLLYKKTDRGMDEIFTLHMSNPIVYAKYYDELAHVCTQGKETYKYGIYSLPLGKWVFKYELEAPVCNSTFDGRLASVCFKDSHCFVLDPIGKQREYKMKLGGDIHDVRCEDKHLKVWQKDEKEPYVFDLSNEIQQRMDEGQGDNERQVFRYRAAEKKRDYQEKIQFFMCEYEKDDHGIFSQEDMQSIKLKETTFYKPRLIEQ